MEADEPAVCADEREDLKPLAACFREGERERRDGKAVVPFIVAARKAAGIDPRRVEVHDQLGYAVIRVGWLVRHVQMG